MAPVVDRKVDEDSHGLERTIESVLAPQFSSEFDEYSSCFFRLIS
jgi:hypothetical protein